MFVPNNSKHVTIIITCNDNIESKNRANRGEESSGRRHLILMNMMNKLIYNLCTICHVMISVSHDIQNQPIFHRGYMMSSRSTGNSNLG